MPKKERHGKFCRFCQDKVVKLDYKDEKRLFRFVGEQGKIIPRRVTGTCARHQRQLAIAVKRARTIALLPYVGKHHRQS
jgi:small subunit ribosomal protein S18